ncbi:thiaminase II [Pseudooceanicola sp. HF7]|uniref:thiaminase II n=1 Tax=Pseudooceanicola sp. HF7 TaxID=2721560 RepID=UPI001431C214|nr:thiaminase II [Pseudooceanicola sp. HF7]NIZ10884.1 thiaminase II [Pseudooceanicola sp. HF7]
MRFRDQLWQATEDLQARIRDMPFNRELAAGSLPPVVFSGYIIQDAHYLEGFARGLSLAASKAVDPQAVAQLAGSAAGAIAVERELHGHYMGLFGVSAAQFQATPVSEACDHYVSFLLRSTALGDFAEGVAALLPCFWIYHEIGQGIAREAAPENPYRAWIDTYSGEGFAEGVERMLALTDRLAAEGDEACRARMQRAFARSCWHEWHFWHSAYHQKGWQDPSVA